jgi:hypothetical protein
VVKSNQKKLVNLIHWSGHGVIFFEIIQCGLRNLITLVKLTDIVELSREIKLYFATKKQDKPDVGNRNGPQLF